MMLIHLAIFTLLYGAYSYRPNQIKWSLRRQSDSCRIGCTENPFQDLDEQVKIFDDLRAKLKGTCVYFIGMMGSGKSTIGDLFAQKLGYRFIDTDDIAEWMIEMPIAEFFAQGNESEFRDVEYKVLMELAQYTRMVISTGGGIVERNANWGILRHGLVVYLDMEAEDIYARLTADPEQIRKRPLLQGENPLGKLKDLQDRRRDRYLQADVRVTVAPTEGPNGIATRTAQAILTYIAENRPLWEQWKSKKQEIAVDVAARANPQATAAAGVGFGQQPKGSIQYVSMSDIQSGKVKLPGSSAVADSPEAAEDIIEGIPKPIPDNPVQ